MKAIINILLGAILFLIISLVGMSYLLDETRLELSKSQRIDLPEEYTLITPNDTLKGYFDSNKVLHIEFNNKRNH